MNIILLVEAQPSALPSKVLSTTTASWRSSTEADLRFWADRTLSVSNKSQRWKRAGFCQLEVHHLIQKEISLWLLVCWWLLLKACPTCCWGSHCLLPAQPAALKPADPVLLQMQIALQPAQTPTAPVPSVWCPSQPHRGSFDRLHELLLCLGADRIVGVLERPAGHDRVNPPRWVPHWVPMTGPHDGNQLTHAHLINSQIPAGGVPFAMLHLAAQPKKVKPMINHAQSPQFYHHCLARATPLKRCLSLGSCGLKSVARPLSQAAARV